MPAPVGEWHAEQAGSPFVESQSALFLFRTVALETMLCENRPDLALELFHRALCRDASERDREQSGWNTESMQERDHRMRRNLARRAPPS